MFSGTDQLEPQVIEVGEDCVVCIQYVHDEDLCRHPASKKSMFNYMNWIMGGTVWEGNLSVVVDSYYS